MLNLGMFTVLASGWLIIFGHHSLTFAIDCTHDSYPTPPLLPSVVDSVTRDNAPTMLSIDGVNDPALPVVTPSPLLSPQPSPYIVVMSCGAHLTSNVPPTL